MFHYSSKYKRKINRAARSFLALILSVLFLNGTIPAQSPLPAGSLDPAFDGDGKLVTALENPDTIAAAVAVQADGKTIVAGLTGAVDSGSATPGSSDFVVLRYNPDGSPDPTFDGDGRAVTSFGDGEDGASAVLVQPDGKILVAGAINTKTPAGEIALARYNANGSPDTTFDGDGKLTTDVAEMQNVEERAEAMILQPDGKIVVLVSSVTDNILNDRVFVVRYNADGSRDNSFAGDGITALPHAIPGGPGGNVVQGLTGSDLALQPDGKIVVAGTVYTDEFGDIFVWRINPDGIDDQTFGGRVVTLSFNRADLAVSVFVQPENKIFVAGATLDNFTPRNDFAFARFNPDGALDTTFGINGKRTAFYSDTLFTLPLDYEIQSDGKIVAVGPVVSGSSGPKSSFAVTRFDADGTRDTTFSDDGKVTTDFGPGLDSAQAVTIADGRIVVAGVTETAAASDNFNLAVARYIGTSGQARRAAFDFDGDGKSDVSVFRASNATWYIQPSSANDSNAFYGVRWGLATDEITPADFDGDGKTDVVVRRSEPQPQGNPAVYTYILQSSTNTLQRILLGGFDQTAAAADWDGDGKAEVAFYGTLANNTSFFYYQPAPGEDLESVKLPVTGKPVQSDYDGDGKTDAAVFVPASGVWHILQSSNLETRFVNWGLATDKLVPADYDGDGRSDPAVFRDGTWYILQSSDGAARYVYWGLNTDRLVPADYDGDGKTDPAVYRDGVWYILQSAGGQMSVRYFGLPDDTPVPAAYRQ